MSAASPDDSLEDLVDLFLGRREREPRLTPEAFAAKHPEAGSPLLGALRAALGVMATLGSDPDPLPERIGGFRVLGEIGRGGMGVVYEVERDGVHRALKRLGVTALLQPRGASRFQREAKALLRIDHPGVVGVHEIGTADGLPFLVMDLVEGRSLDGLGPLPWRRAAALCRDIGAALGAVHEAGLFHRDLKPQNVLLRADGSPVIVDFGLVHDNDDITLTGSGDLLGTPRYLAPEQAVGRRTDARTDVHALGLILAELLTGEPARPGHDRSSTLAAAAAGGAPDLSGARDLPRALVRIVRVATALRPRWRYATARAMVEDLDRLLAGGRVGARPPGLWVRTVDAVRHRPRAAAMWTVLLLTAAGASVWWQQDALASARANRAQAHFDDAVLAWCEEDRGTLQREVAATLAAVPRHAGALALRAIDAGAVPPASTDARGERLRQGIEARADQQWGAAAVAFGAAAAADPACSLSRILLAEAEERAGRLVEAERELASACNMLPDSAALAAALGALHARRGDHRSAAACLRRAVELRPSSFALHYRLARADLAFDAESGLSEVRAALGLLAPGDAKARRDALHLEASLLDKLGRPTDAVVIFERLVAESPGEVRACFNLAYSLDRLLRVREAKEWYEKALALDPDNQSATLCLVWLLITTEEEDLRDVDRAETLLVAALERDRGRSEGVQRMVRDFGLRTGRIERLTVALTQLMDAPEVSQHARATLEHLRNNLRAGAPKTDR